MSKAHFSVADFRATVLAKGLARTNRFEIIITPPASLRSTADLVSLYAEQAAIPLLGVTTKPFKIFGPATQKPVTVEYGGEGMSVIFHADREMKIRTFFENWMHTVVDRQTYTVGYYNDYIGTVAIRQLDEENNITHEIELVDAFPRNMTQMDINHTSTNQTHRINVIFAYRYWRNKALSTPNPTPRALRFGTTVNVRPQQTTANKPVSTAPSPRLADGLDGENGVQVGAGSFG